MSLTSYIHLIIHLSEEAKGQCNLAAPPPPTEAVFKENYGVWDPMLELTITCTRVSARKGEGSGGADFVS